ncbi:MAG: hypothetical protein QOG94_2747 [Solirubrobacteraceae bacterium]|jgi:hypothetical protein|nr:hypothetical protein [Solirubrobacteraceae bacterium]MEA2138712.1 hypothetical protein [Solirubrobacteraceae bacterium]
MHAAMADIGKPVRETERPAPVPLPVPEREPLPAPPQRTPEPVKT